MTISAKHDRALLVQPSQQRPNLYGVD